MIKTYSEELPAENENLEQMIFRFYVNNADYQQKPDKLIAGSPVVAQKKEIRTGVKILKVFKIT